jgi:thioredoxin-dependent peroxiredoxin
VLGVSPDPVPELRAFADKYGLPFTLLSDVDHQVAERYGVWTQVKVGDRMLWGNERSTVLIDPEGVVARVFPSVDPTTHDELLLGALAESGARAG